MSLTLTPILAYYLPAIFLQLPFWALGLVVASIYYSIHFIMAFYCGIPYLKNLWFALFIVYVIFSFVFSTVYYGEFSPSPIILFILTMILFLGVLNSNFESHFDVVNILRIVSFSIIAYGLYQWLSFQVDLYFFDPEVYRGRGSGPERQITSIFEEPAFYSLYLISVLYWLLFIEDKISIIAVIVVIASVVLTRSVGGYVAAFWLLSWYIVSGYVVSVRDFLLTGNFKCLGCVIFGLVVILVTGFIFSFVTFSAEYFQSIFTRLTSEVIINLDKLGAPPSLEGSSGYLRVINEINTVVFVLLESPLFGLGIDYENSDLGREMALNGLVEIIVRWGALGFLLLGMALFMEKRRFPSKDRLAFLMFILLYFSIDGAIAKPGFWLHIGLILLLERLMFLDKHISRKIYAVES